MAKTKKESVEIKPEKPKEGKKFFPKLMILFSLLLIVGVVLSFFNVFSFSKLVMEIGLLLAGLWLLKLGIGKGFYGKRKEIIKKYI
ncbi:hypothetical protein GOV03_03810 [Candidatus Woesearchaeota archaeon]|nr:hypothetical protein [Candidatus Woesearchaeota archaeon]